MPTQDNSEYASLASKIDELSQVCARLSRENAELRDRMSRLTSADTSSLPAGAASAGRGAREERQTPDGKLSRRRLGKALAASAAGVVGAAALVEATARPAAANTGDTMMAGDAMSAETATTLNIDSPTAAPGVIFLANKSSFTASDAIFPAALGGWTNGGNVPSGVYALTEDGAGYGVVARNVATSGKGVAVAGFSDSTAGDVFAVQGTINPASPGGFSAGVRGINNGTAGLGIGVWGSHAGSGFGVYGTSVSGTGVVASGGTGTGMEASGSLGVVAQGSTIGVLASSGGSGTGVQATGGTGVSAGGSTVGLSASGPTAVRASGTSTGVSASGPTGVHGSGSGTAGVGVKGNGAGSGGRGGIFAGKAAQVKLSPGTLGTHPKSGQRGDLYADNKGRLWFCKTGGNTALWHQIA